MFAESTRFVLIAHSLFYVMMFLYLYIKIQRDRIRESVHRVDPGGAALRSVTTHRLQRRLYAVAGPNSLWHLDGYHKLIRYLLSCKFASVVARSYVLVLEIGTQYLDRFIKATVYRLIT
jgi:hypothetical protein